MKTGPFVSYIIWVEVVGRVFFFFVSDIKYEIESSVDRVDPVLFIEMIEKWIKRKYFVYTRSYLARKKCYHVAVGDSMELKS